MTVGDGALIKARAGSDGIFAEGAGQSITVHGRIDVGAIGIHGAIWGTAGYTVLLCFTLFKTGSLSKSLFSAR